MDLMDAFWNDISYVDWSLLIFIIDNLTTQQYIQKIEELHLLPLR